MRRYSLLLALAALIVVALPATATTLTWYTDRAAWEAAVGDIFIELNRFAVTVFD